MKKKKKFEAEIVECDICKDYSMTLDSMSSCIICGKDLCVKCTKRMGLLFSGATLCKSCRKDIKKFYRKLKEEKGNPIIDNVI